MPQLVADVDALYQPYVSQGSQSASAEITSLPESNYAWQMIGWSGTPDCGGGLRIGLIDSAIAAGAPTFDLAKIHQKSFAEDGEDDPDTQHCTAISSLLVGHNGDDSHPHWRGLLPSAELYAGSVFGRRGGPPLRGAPWVRGGVGL